MRDKRASTDYPVHELLAARWSPYAFQDRPVPEADLRSLFEAARWAPSSYNEQPWSYIVATKENPEQFEHLLSCLVAGNQVWAQAALAIGYRADPTHLPDTLKERELTPRHRKPLSQFVFSGKWGNPSPLVLKR